MAKSVLIQVTKERVPLTESATDAAQSLLEMEPLITAVVLMNGTYSVEQDKEKIGTPLI